jgi:mannitol-1-phosphate 5-dehydrogenase
LTGLLPTTYEFDRLVGLIEASIGKMVPPMTHKDLAVDPLWLFAESFNTLIVDRHGFQNKIPEFEGFRAVDNIAAYVDHKLLLFNMSHAATAYFAYQRDPNLRYIADALAVPEIARMVRRCMEQSAAALNRTYPEEFALPDLQAFIVELLDRFQNRALGDTVARVGRDIRRKLHKQDRLVGAMLLAKKHGCRCDAIAEAVVAGCKFRAAGESGTLYSGDIHFAEQDYPLGLEHILTHVCQLSRANKLEADVMEEIMKNYTDWV